MMSDLLRIMNVQEWKYTLLGVISTLEIAESSLKIVLIQISNHYFRVSATISLECPQNKEIPSNYDS